MVTGQEISAHGPRAAVAADFELPIDAVAMTPKLVATYEGEFLYGRPHPNTASFWFCARFGRYDGEITGFVSREEFNWLAERLGTPKLEEADAARIGAGIPRDIGLRDHGSNCASRKTDPYEQSYACDCGAEDSP